MNKHDQIENLITTLTNKKGGCKGVTLVDTTKNINLMTCERIKKLGQGKFGKVYLLKCDGKEYVVKKICSQYILNKDVNKDKYSNEFYEDQVKFAKKYPSFVTHNVNKLEKEIMKEITALELLSKMKLSPKVYDSWLCKTSEHPCGYIVMEKFDMTLKTLVFESIKYYYLKKDVDGAVASIKKISKLIKELADKKKIEKIYVGDIHSDNVMVKFKNSDSKHLFEPDNLLEIRHIDLGMGAYVIDDEDDRGLKNNINSVGIFFRAFQIWSRLLVYSSEPKFVNFVDSVLEESLDLNYPDLLKQYRSWYNTNKAYVEMEEEDEIQIKAINNLYPEKPKPVVKRRVYYDSDTDDSDSD
jgi:serine/threonine protein kinase